MNVGGPFISSFDISSSGEVLAFGDSLGYIHLWSNHEDVKVNVYSRHTLELLDLRPPPPSRQITEQRYQKKTIITQREEIFVE